MSILLIAAVAAALTQAPAQPSDGRLRITASAPVGATCATRIAVFNGEAAYTARTPSAQAVLSAVSAVTFELPRGDYAVVAWCDLDGNGLLDRDADGRPTEPFALSGVDELRGPPAFSDLRVAVEDSAEVLLKLR